MTDLRSRLHAVVDGPEPAGEARPDRGATALDDVVVGALTTRIRRRRAVRTGAAGALGALTVAAVAVGATALTDGRGTASVPAGTEQPQPDGATGLTLDCGDGVSLDSLRPENGDMVLGDPEVVSSTTTEGDLLDVRIRLRNEGEDDLTWDTMQVVQLAALEDGSVVATGSVPIGYVGTPGVRWTWTDAVVMSPCGAGTALPAGEYDLLASVVLADADGTDALGLSSGPVPFSVTSAARTEEERRAEAERRTEAEVALAEVVAAAATARPDAAVGTCGTRLPEVTDPYLGLDIELSPAAPGASLEGAASLTTRDGLRVVGDASITGARVVLTLDGVVVGRGEADPDYVNRLVVTADRPLELPAVGDAVLCRLPGDDGPTLPLPAGTYQAYGLYQVAVTEVEQTDGDAVEVTPLVTGTRTVVSEPVDVVVDDQLG